MFHQQQLSDASSKLQALAKDMDQVMQNHGLMRAGADCHTECSITIGPDGKPVYSCKLVCNY